MRAEVWEGLNKSRTTVLIWSTQNGALGKTEIHVEVASGTPDGIGNTVGADFKGAKLQIRREWGYGLLITSPLRTCYRAGTIEEPCFETGRGSRHYVRPASVTLRQQGRSQVGRLHYVARVRSLEPKTDSPAAGCIARVHLRAWILANTNASVTKTAATNKMCNGKI